MPLARRRFLFTLESVESRNDVGSGITEQYRNRKEAVMISKPAQRDALKGRSHTV